ncbi:MAG: hypothetical protein PHV50_03965 [Syntrophaceticus sp.]|nr:hypothetical protein [Syntrophaceticus sp.]
MPIDGSNEFKKRKYRRGLIFCIAIAVIGVSYFGYYLYRQNAIHIQEPEGFSVECKTDDISLAGEKWLEAYTEQYRQKYMPRSQKLIEYGIDDIDIKESNVIQIDFWIVTAQLDEKTAFDWNGGLEDNKIYCQWVLWFDKETTSDDTIVYTVTKLQRPAGYDLEKYQTSGEKEQDEYQHKYVDEIPYEQQQYTYKIENGICSVSYDHANTWREVPVPLETLAKVGDGHSYYNQLQQGSFLITPEKTAFVYGGTRENKLMITYTEDMGAIWKTAEIGAQLESIRVKFCSFPTVSVGYVIAAGDRTMSQEGQAIYQTTDGGSSWNEVGYGPSTWLLQYGGFVDENVGFMSYPKIDGAETNFYRTEDGGKTFEPIILPIVEEEWMGISLEPYIQPETPYFEGGQLFLLVGQGGQGDFMGGNVMAKYKSEDMGKTWSFVESVERKSFNKAEG